MLPRLGTAVTTRLKPSQPEQRARAPYTIRQVLLWSSPCALFPLIPSKISSHTFSAATAVDTIRHNTKIQHARRSYKATTLLSALSYTHRCVCAPRPIRACMYTLLYVYASLFFDDSSLHHVEPFFCFCARKLHNFVDKRSAKTRRREVHFAGPQNGAALGHYQETSLVSRPILVCMYLVARPHRATQDENEEAICYPRRLQRP